MRTAASCEVPLKTDLSPILTRLIPNIFSRMSEDVSAEGKSKLPLKVEILKDLFEAFRVDDVAKATEILDSNDIDANFADQVCPCHFIATSLSQFLII